MNMPEIKPQGRNIPWFKSWFDSSFYHSLYAHRNENEAEQFVEALINELQPASGSSMLDVGCGAGRHSKFLASKGYIVTGIDLALSSIRSARKFQSSSLHFFQHDMRKPFGYKQYDLVFNFFTSFGYFQHQAENQMVIRNMVQALKPGGNVVIDYLNTAYAESTLVSEEIKEIDGIRYDITRWADNHFFYKKIAIGTGQLNDPIEHVEQVRKFSLNDFIEMFKIEGVHLIEVYGDYELNDYASEKSSRMIMVVSGKNS